MGNFPVLAWRAADKLLENPVKCPLGGKTACIAYVYDSVFRVA